MKKSVLPRIVLVLALFAVCFSMGWGWLQRTASNEELLADTARYMDVLRGFASVGGICWWTPNFLNGHSLAPMLVAFNGVFGFSLLALLLAPWMSALAAFKLAGLIIVFLAGLAMFFFARRITGNEWLATAAAVLYAGSPQFVLRLAVLEHVALSACFIFPPLILLFLMRLSEAPTRRDELFLAMSVSGLALAYTKLLILFLPAAAMFCLALLIANPPGGRRFVFSCVRAALYSVPLGVIPLLPATREFRWMAVFELEPFQPWQQFYSFYSAISWIDIANLVTAGNALPAFITSKHPYLDFYVGLACMVAIVLGLVSLPHLKAPLQETRWLRTFTAMMLLTAWLSSGPRSIFSSHMLWLGGAAGVADIVIALFWAMLAVQIWMLWHILPASRFRAPFTVGLTFIYLFVPGFRILEILPIFQHVRAPNAVWAVAGTISFVTAAICGLQVTAARLGSGLPRTALYCGFAALALLDFTSTFRAFYRPGLSVETFVDFDTAQKFLKEQPEAGSVFALSGRYFFGRIPEDTGRPLMNEALARHFQPKWARYMESTSFAKTSWFKEHATVNGTRFTLVDKTDPELGATAANRFKGSWTAAFSNNHFDIYENTSSLAPAFFSSRVVPVGVDAYLKPDQVFGALAKDTLPVEPPINVAPDTAQQSLPDKVLSIDSAASSYERIVIPNLPGRDGVVVVTMNFHPDWRAYGSEGPLPVARAAGSLLAAGVKASDRSVEFRFEPPGWYDLVMYLSLACWTIAILLGLLSSRVGIPPMRRWFVAPQLEAHTK